jgi:DNA-binding transcriptional LysR family regulator
VVELRQLRQFIAIAEELSFRRAAARLHMSQPPLSAAIQRLEEIVGRPLLERSRHHVKLTSAGEAFLREARRTIAQARLAVEGAQRAADGQEGTLRLSFVPSATLGILPILLRTFQREYPTVRLALTGDTTTRQVDMLRRTEVDLAIVVPPLNDPRDLKLDVLREEPFVLAVPVEHPLAASKRIDLKEVAAEPFISFPLAEGPGFVGSLLKACQQAGFAPRIVQEASQMQTILTLVAGGIGVALVPASMRTVHMQNVVYLELIERRQPVRYSLVFAYHAGHDNPVIDAFLSMTHRVLKTGRKEAATGDADGPVI